MQAPQVNTLPQSSAVIELSPHMRGSELSAIASCTSRWRICGDAACIYATFSIAFLNACSVHDPGLAGCVTAKCTEACGADKAQQAATQLHLQWQEPALPQQATMYGKYRQAAGYTAALKIRLKCGFIHTVEDCHKQPQLLL